MIIALFHGEIDMSVEEFRDYCTKFKFYYFITKKDFDNKIDYNGVSIKDKLFERGIIDNGVNGIPTRYSAYGTKFSMRNIKISRLRRERNKEL